MDYKSLSQQKIKKLRSKYLRSKWLFLIISIALILMSAFNGLLSAYAIAKNPNLEAVKLFIAISFITAIMAFLTSVLTVFAFLDRASKNKEKIEFLDSKIEELSNNVEFDQDELINSIANIDIHE